MPLPKDTRISHVHLRVKNMERELSFYDQLLGFSEVTRYDSTVALSSTGQLPFQILLTESPNAVSRPTRATGLFHLAIRFPNRTELAKTVARIVRSGYPLSGSADHLVSEAIYLADPEGNGIELYCDRPSSDWRWQGAEIAMATEPLDVEALLAEVSGIEWSGIHPKTDIGHVHLNVGELSDAEEFYHRLLHFDVTTRSYPGALFLAAGGYHHHIGTNVWLGTNVPRPPEGSLRLMSFGISLPKENWNWLRDSLAVKGVPFSISQMSGSDESIALVDPDGIKVEIIPQ